MKVFSHPPCTARKSSFNRLNPCAKHLYLSKTLLLGYIFLFISFPTYAQFWNDLKNSVGSLAGAAVKVTTAPYEVIANAGKAVTGNGDVKDIYKPYQQVASATGGAVNNTSQLLYAPQQFMMQKAQEFSTNIGGDPGAFAFDVGTFFNRYCTDLGYSATQSAGNTLQGQNPLQMFAAPLAAGIRAARESHYPRSYPLPDNIKSALRGHFSDEILNKARYTQGQVQITLPNFIGQGQKFMGNDGYAVTVDDVIVFNSDPNNSSLNHWAHEIYHIVQYTERGIDAFAFDYLKDLGRSIENEAVGRANQITGNQTSVTQSYLTARTFDMTAEGVSQTISQQNPEIYVSQCIFPGDRFGVMYLVTNYGRIVAINPMNGSWLHIGYILPSSFPEEACSYWVPNANMRYSISRGGIILQSVYVRNNFGQVIYNQFGQPVTQRQSIGTMVKLQ